MAIKKDQISVCFVKFWFSAGHIFACLKSRLIFGLAEGFENQKKVEVMAIRASDSRSEKAFYDPFYMAREGPPKNNCEESSRKLFDDFSVANHVHILKPQMVSVNVRSVLQTTEKTSHLENHRGLVVEKDEEDHRPHK